MGQGVGQPPKPSLVINAFQVGVLSSNEILYETPSLTIILQTPVEVLMKTDVKEGKEC